MPSMTAVRVNPTLKAFYQRLKPKKVKPIVALVAVQRKLLLLMYSLYKNKTFYEPSPC
jgi:transposase